MEVKIKYFNGQQPLEKIAKGDWIDLRANEDVIIYKGQRKNIPLGVAMELPQGHHAQIAPRGSTHKKFGIIMPNSPGVVDHTFCGDNDEWVMPAYCTDGDSYDDECNKFYTIIKRGDRICQFRIVKNMEEFTFTEVKTLGNPDRGLQGSTGYN